MPMSDTALHSTLKATPSRANEAELATLSAAQLTQMLRSRDATIESLLNMTR